LNNILCTLPVFLLTLLPANGNATQPEKPGVHCISDLISGLQSNNPIRRAHCAAELAKLGPKARGALPSLIKAMRDENKKVRFWVSRALKNIGPCVIGPLTKQLDNKNPAVRLLAVQTLGLLVPAPKAAVPTLIKALVDKDSAVRALSVEVLGRIKEEVALGPIMGILTSDNDVKVHRAAILAIGKFGHKAHKAVPILIKMVKDPSSYREWKWNGSMVSGGYKGSMAAESLAHIGSVCVIPLTNVFKDRTLCKSSRLAASSGLESMGPKAEPAVASLTKTLKDPDKDIREAALRVLEKIGPKAKAAMPKIGKLLADSSALVRFQAAVTLYGIDKNNPATVPALIQGIKKGNDRIRFASISMLGEIGAKAKAAVPVLAKALQDEDPDNRRAAARALGAMGPVAIRSIESLLRALSDPDKDVRAEASEAIERIKRKR
jgi:HEAT repeat protein